MIAKMKCSNCGAEMSNLNFTWGKKYLWFMLPVVLLGFFPLIKMTFFKADATRELAVSDVERRGNGQTIEIFGLITNTGSHQWSGLTLEAEFYDASGKFIDEAQEYLRSDVSAGAKEHFKITLARPAAAALVAADTKMVVKVSGGHTPPF